MTVLLSPLGAFLGRTVYTQRRWNGRA